MTKRYGVIIGVAIALIALVMIVQSSLTKRARLGIYESIVTLLKPQTGRELSQDEIESGRFHNLKLKVYGLSCVSCSSTVFYGIVNVKGIVNADIRPGTSCIIYDSREITKTELMHSALFTSGVYMAMGDRDTVIRRKEDMKCL